MFHVEHPHLVSNSDLCSTWNIGPARAFAPTPRHRVLRPNPSHPARSAAHFCAFGAPCRRMKCGFPRSSYSHLGSLILLRQALMVSIFDLCSTWNIRILYRIPIYVPRGTFAFCVEFRLMFHVEHPLLVSGFDLCSTWNIAPAGAVAPLSHIQYSRPTPQIPPRSAAHFCAFRPPCRRVKYGLHRSSHCHTGSLIL